MLRRRVSLEKDEPSGMNSSGVARGEEINIIKKEQREVLTEQLESQLSRISNVGLQGCWEEPLLHGCVGYLV